MKRRIIIFLAAVVVFIGALGAVKYFQIGAAIAKQAGYMPPPEAVTTKVAAQTDWQVTLSAIGTVTAVQGVVVSADLPGIVASIDFESGRPVHEGDVLVRLDTKQEEAQLAAAEAQQHFTRLNRDRVRSLSAEKAIAQADVDQAEAEAMQAEARVREIHATIDRKTIRAPFSGVLGIRQINVGQYVNPGQAIVPLQSMNPVYVDFSVPQNDLRKVRVGQGLRITVEGDSAAAAQGKVTAVNSVIDRSTRNVQVQATLPNREGRLRPGMFVEASVLVGETQSVVALPSSAIAHTPYGDFVFILGDVKSPDGTTYRGVRQQIVKLGSARGDQVAVLEGVASGDEVATSGVFKLRPGARVMVNNEIQPSDNPAPKPEDN